MRIRELQLRRNITKHERIFRDMLDQLRCRYTFQKGYVVTGKIMIVDFCVHTPCRLLIEIDGGSHTPVKARQNDAIRDAIFSELGLRMIRLTNQEVEALSLPDIRTILGVKTRMQRKENIYQPHDDGITVFANCVSQY
jgi:very-short-patch-repair endonuclease